MALKGDTHILRDDINYFWVNGQTGTRGGMAVHSTGGSGVALDDPNGTVRYEADPSGKKPAGVLLGDVVNKDLTQTHLNFYKDETITGGKVRLGVDGWVVTDMIEGTPTIGAPAYLGHSGYFSTTELAGAGGAVGRIGTFKSIKDQDNFARVEFRPL